MAEAYPLVGMARRLPAEYEAGRLRATALEVRENRCAFGLFEIETDIPLGERRLGDRLDVVPGLDCRVVYDGFETATLEVSVGALFEALAGVPDGQTFRLSRAPGAYEAHMADVSPDCANVPMTLKEFERFMTAYVGSTVGADVKPGDSPAEARRKVVTAAKRMLAQPHPLLEMVKREVVDGE